MAFKLDGTDNLVSMCWIASSGTKYNTITLAMAAVGADDAIITSEGEFIEDVSFSQNGLKLIGQGRQNNNKWTDRY